jgi:thiamine-monophosphate kinase
MEFQYIEWLRARTPVDPRVLIGPGDDCAALASPTRPLLITTDMLMDGTDFVVAEVGPRRAGRKAMAANLSDIAAMAGVPIAAVVSVALPRQRTEDLRERTFGRGQKTEDRGQKAEDVGEQTNSELSSVFCPLSSVFCPLSSVLSRRSSDSHLLTPQQFAEELYIGLRDVADAFGVPIVGGDTNSWAGSLVISVTALGEATERGAVRRNGAKPGDWIFVTGPLGGSILGHHLDFTPRVREALALHSAVELHAMCDISDGLAADLNHILEESRCGAVLAAEAIPVSSAAKQLSATSGRTPLQHALGDGEDFELVFAVSPADGEKLLREAPVGGLAKIGVCVESGLWLETAGKREPLAPTGWVHAWGM